ncbi:MAG: DNA polymerase III subunit alpha, partial [Bacteroidota bacterium]
MYLIFDTETTGLPRDYNAPLTDFNNWPRLVQIAWQLHSYDGELMEAKNFIIKPDGFTIPFNSESVHGISTAMAEKYGRNINEVLKEFAAALEKTTHISGHNVDFDLKIAGSEFLRNEHHNAVQGKIIVDSMIESTGYCELPGGRGGGFKYPSLSELHQKLFGQTFMEAHNAVADVVATARCFLELIRLGVLGEKQLRLKKEVIGTLIAKYTSPIQAIELDVISNKELSDKLAREAARQEAAAAKDFSKETTVTAPFTHLHVHSYFSVLSASSSLESLIGKASALGMKAIALTDMGNLFGAFNFIQLANKNNIKPIVGCELYLVEDRRKLKFTKDNPDRKHQQVFLAKNLSGYRNLSRLSSTGWIEGNYAGFPRIDREVLVKYKDDLITTTGWIYSEVNDLILNVGEQQAEEAFVWWKEQFGDDFYVQLNRHGLQEEVRTNQVLLQFARKYDVKVIAANNVYYVDQEDHDIHDSLLCIKDNEYQSTPIGRGRNKRFGYPQKEFYLKSHEEMEQEFADIPEAISNTQEIVDKVEPFSLKRKPMMPDFEMPEGFEDADDYLRHLTYEGAKTRYDEITDEIRERIDFELATIKKMGYPGYFLIVQDFLHEARKMGVWVGPGRGSAAGSVAAYCLRITDVDPIEYDLLFERFLNPDRISLPDIDIDFDEDGRDRILKWVVNKYGQSRVAHIITFGKMAPKMAIRDVARVKQLPLSEANRLAKLIPIKPGIDFKGAYKEAPELLKEKENAQDPLIKTTLLSAEKLEGTVRNVGTHACGIIISKEDLIDHIPVSTAKDAELLVTQFDGNHIEDAGMLKMDFLGLKTLSIIKDAVENVRKSRNIDIDINNIPHDDEETFKLYSRGDTTGIFQFESE